MLGYTFHEHLMQHWARASAVAARDSGCQPLVLDLNHVLSDAQLLIRELRTELEATSGGRKRLAAVEARYRDQCRSRWSQRAAERAAQ